MEDSRAYFLLQSIFQFSIFYVNHGQCVTLVFVRSCFSVVTSFDSRTSDWEVPNTIHISPEEGERVGTNVILQCMLARVF